MTAAALFEMIKQTLVVRRAAFRQRHTYAFAVIDGGGFVLDTHAPGLIEPTYREGCDVSILCNTRTLADIVLGRFDPDAPRAHHLFRFGGDREALRALAQALHGSTSLLALRTTGRAGAAS